MIKTHNFPIFQSQTKKNQDGDDRRGGGCGKAAEVMREMCVGVGGGDRRLGVRER